jgi:hypothetical protein
MSTTGRKLDKNQKRNHTDLAMIAHSYNGQRRKHQ